ncbi:MAG: WYL domain-containing protein [Burkholderiaceae bacterium]|nr:WYL domain-containing protein [Burkholderiaceae bacterium]
MSRTERIYRIGQLLTERKTVSRSYLLTDLEISPATLKRDLEYMRERLNAPIEWDRDAGGYRFRTDSSTSRYQFPGLWFSATEIVALLTMRQLLDSLEPKVISAKTEPFLSKMRKIVEQENIPVAALEKRIRIRRQARICEFEHFMPVASAVLQRKRMNILHHGKQRDETLLRQVSPQRLTHYRENWYLDAWCHLRGELRSFSLSALREVIVCDIDAVEVPAEELAAVLDSGYGIFSGREPEWAELVFSNERARWVSQELWHDDQEAWFDSDGRYHLRFPYSDPREVCMDVLRHVPEVRVVSPASLRSRITTLLNEALQRI